MEIRENINNISSADNYLQLRYKLDNTNDSFTVQVENGFAAWNTRGASLTSTSWTTDWSYTLSSSEVIGGTVQLRFVDANPIDTSATNLLIDYLRVRSQAASWSTSLVMKLHTGGDNNPYDGGWSEEWNFTVVPVGAIGILLMSLLMLLPLLLVLRRQNRQYHY